MAISCVNNITVDKAIGDLLNILPITGIEVDNDIIHFKHGVCGSTRKIGV